MGRHTPSKWFSLVAAASILAGGLTALAPAATAKSGAAPPLSLLGPEIAHALANAPFDPLGQVASSANAGQAVVNFEIRTATADLATALGQHHAGRTETLTHPAADTANAGGRVSAKAPAVAAPPTSLPGLDVASYQGNVNWAIVAAHGAKFAYAKATEGTYYTNPYFTEQYQGSYDAGLVRGAYHFAVPNNSTGAAQADFFVAHGGAWAPDHQTLPGMVDLEYNPYGSMCYGLSQAQMVGWISAFVNRYHADTTRWPVIYTTANWWATCTGNYTAFAANDPLFIANYNGTPYPLVAGWVYYSLWQFSDYGLYPGDQDVFNGSLARLVVLADGQAPPPPTKGPPAPGAPPAGLLQILNKLLGVITSRPPA